MKPLEQQILELQEIIQNIPAQFVVLPSSNRASPIQALSEKKASPLASLSDRKTKTMNSAFTTQNLDENKPENDKITPEPSNMIRYHQRVKKMLSYEGNYDEKGRAIEKTQTPMESNYVFKQKEDENEKIDDIYRNSMIDLKNTIKQNTNYENKLNLLFNQESDDILLTGGSSEWWESDIIKPRILKELAAMKPRTIPNSATIDEVLQVIQQAVNDLGLHIWEEYRFYYNKTLKIDREPLQEEYAIAVYYYLINLTKDSNGDLFYGNNTKLTRLKFQGGLTQLLQLKLSYDQQDRAYRMISKGEDGDLTLDEWIDVMVYPKGLTLLFKEDKYNLNDIRNIRKALDVVCYSLEQSNLSLVQFFEAFDRDGSGEISIAEFTTMMRHLQKTIIPAINAKQQIDNPDDIMSVNPLTQTQMYHMLRMIDREFNRTINIVEFLEFFKVIWSQRLIELQDKEKEVIMICGLHKTGYINEYYLFALQEKIKSIKKVLFKTYGKKAIEAPELGLKILPGPYAGIYNKLNMLPKSVKLEISEKYEDTNVKKLKEIDLPDIRMDEGFFKEELDREVLSEIPKYKSNKVEIDMKKKDINKKLAIKGRNELRLFQLNPYKYYRYNLKLDHHTAEVKLIPKDQEEKTSHKSLSR